MNRSYRNEAFATHRQKEARNLIDEYVEFGFTIQKISEKTGLATSTISSWFRDACPNPRTLRKLKLIKSEIKKEKKLEDARKQVKKWYQDGGKQRVLDAHEYMKSEEFKVLDDEAQWNYWRDENRHESDGRFMNLLDGVERFKPY